jgi:DNA-binding response OmpR family regulator
MSSYTILLISNGLYGCDRWKNALSGEDISILSATALDLSMSQYGPDSFDIIVVDASGHAGQDIELCSRLRRRFDMPLLLASSHLAVSACVAAYGAGVDECIAGPISDRLLRAKVKVWLRWTRRSFVVQDSLSFNYADLQSARLSEKV